MGNCLQKEMDLDDKSNTEEDTLEELSDRDDSFAIRTEREGDEEALGGSMTTTTYSEKELKRLGVSVHCLRHVLLKEVLEAGFDESSTTFFQIENASADSMTSDCHSSVSASASASPFSAYSCRRQRKRNHDTNTNTDSDSDGLNLIRTRGKDIVCPITGNIGAAYVHSLGYNQDYVGPAQSMLSYSSRYTLHEIIQALESYCSSYNLNPKRTYIWINSLCYSDDHDTNNNNNTKPAFQEFHDRVEKRIHQIGHVICVMAPWNKDTYLSRIWPLYEVYVANQIGCSIVGISPTNQKQKLAEVFLKWGQEEGTLLEDLYSSLVCVNVERAKANNPDDLQYILQTIKNSPGGYDNFNAQVGDLMRSWVTEIMSDLVDDFLRNENQDTDMEYFCFIDKIGGMLSLVGELDRAMDLYKKTLLLREIAVGINHQDVATSYNNIGMVLQKKGQYDFALSFHKTALLIQKTVHGEHHTSMADTHVLIGDLHHHQGQSEEAMASYQKALVLFEFVSGVGHPNTAMCYCNIGSLLRTNKRVQEAYALHKRALKIYHDNNENNDYDTSIAATCFNIGYDLQTMGKLEDALVMYNEGMQIQEDVLGQNHKDTATSYTHIGFVLQGLDNHEKALEMHQKALNSYMALCGYDDPLISTSFHHIGSTLQAMGEFEEALLMYKKALAINQRIHGLRHPDCAASYIKVGSVFCDLGEFEQALEMCQMAHTFYLSIYGSYHPETRRTQSLCSEIHNRLHGGGEENDQSHNVHVIQCS